MLLALAPVPLPNAERSKPNRVSRNTAVSDSADVALHGGRPLTFGVKMAVEAGRGPGVCDQFHRMAGKAVDVEGRVMPEDEKRPSLPAELGRVG